MKTCAVSFCEAILSRCDRIARHFRLVPDDRNLFPLIPHPAPFQGEHHIRGANKVALVLFPADAAFAVTQANKLLFHVPAAVWTPFLAQNEPPFYSVIFPNQEHHIVLPPIQYADSRDQLVIHDSIEHKLPGDNEEAKIVSTSYFPCSGASIRGLLASRETARRIEAASLYAAFLFSEQFRYIPSFGQYPGRRRLGTQFSRFLLHTQHPVHVILRIRSRIGPPTFSSFIRRLRAFAWISAALSSTTWNGRPPAFRDC